MKVKGLDGRQYSITGTQAKANDTRPRSAGHMAARKLLKAMFPFGPILEEAFVPGCQYQLYLDFLMPRQSLVVEVQGIQHRQFTPYFHGTMNGFIAQKRRDRIKKSFCVANNLVVVELNDDERDNPDTWERAIREALSRTEAGEG